MKSKLILRVIGFIAATLITFQGIGQKVFKTKNVVDHWQNAVMSNDLWRYFPANKEPDSNWNQLNYIDTTWFSGKGGIGFGDGDDSTVVASGISSLYIRNAFYLNDTSKIWDLLLNADYDDGFVAYLNGIEIARKNIGTKGIRPKFSDLASGPHEANMYQGGAPDYIYIPKSIFSQILRNGRNIFCVQIHNDQLNSSDLTGLFWLHLGINDTSGTTPAPPSWFAPTLVTHLPIVVLNTLGQNIPNEPKLTCKMGIIENGTDQNHYTDSFNHYNGWIGIETRGSSSSGFPQQSYGFSLYADSLGNQWNQKLLGFPKEHDYILYAPYTDKSMMRNNLIYELSRQMGHYASRTKFVELILNGTYQGIYVLMENIKADKNRVDIPTMEPQQTSGDTITGGYIMKVDRVKQNGPGYWKSAVTNFNGQGKDYWIQTVDPDIPDLNQPQLNYIKPWMDNFESVLLSANYSNTNNGFKRTTDVNSFIDFYLANELTRNVDAYRLSNFFFKQRESLGGRLYMGPVWDFNIAFGNANYCNGFDTAGWNDCGYNNIPFWYERMLQDADYKRQLVCRWQGYRKDILKLQHLYDYIDSTAEYLELAQRRHYQRWQILGQYVWPNYYIGATYKDEVNFLKKWVRGRLNWMDKNMPKVPAICNSASASGIYVTEIMYNCAANRNGGNWIELYNAYGIAYNVGNFVIRDESGFRSYTIPPNTVIPSGGYLAIVEDTAAFGRIYPGVKNRVGPMNWGFPNKEGTISVRDASNYLVGKISYADSLPWPQLADGKGHSLELIKTGMNYNLPGSWRNGCIDGTPGSGPNCAQPILITEINYASAKSYNAGDWVEIYNRDTADQNLSGWQMRDDNDSNIFSFPSGTILKSGTRLVLSNDQKAFKNIYTRNISLLGDFKFGFSSTGDAVRLFDSSKHLVAQVWYSDSLPFPYGAKGTGLTLELSDSATNAALPENWRLSCFLGTPGRSRRFNCQISNQPQCFLSEIFTYPDQLDNPGKWLEFKSKDSLTIDLSGVNLRINGMNLYKFPTGTIWKPYEYITLAGDSVAFTQKYNKISISVPALKSITLPMRLSLFADSGDTLFATMITQPADECVLQGRGIDLADSSGFKGIRIGCLGGSPSKASVTCVEFNYLSEIHEKDGGWIEIRGIDSIASDISGYTLRWGNGGQSYTFPAGTKLSWNERKVYVSDSLSFKLSHPFAPVSGILGAKVDSAGHIRLYHTSGALIYNFCYQNKGLTAGYSLERTGVSGAAYDSIFWFNACLKGSAGMVESSPCNPALTHPMSFTEIMQFPDTISQGPRWAELYFQGNYKLPMNGWGILDQHQQVLLKFNEKDTMTPGQLYIFTPNKKAFLKYYSNFTGQIYEVSTWLSPDSIFIYDYHSNEGAACGDPTSYQLRFSQHTGRSLELPGNHPGCVTGTPGLLSSPCPYSLLVTEIMQASNPGGSWFEIQNISSDTISLKNYKYLSHSGKLQAFAQDTLNPGEIMVLSNDTQAFYQWYGRSNKVRTGVFQLNDSFGTLQIYNEKNMPVQAVIYEISGGWPHQTNYSIELLADTGNPCQSSSWQLRCRYGLPGKDRNTICVNTGLGSEEDSNRIRIYPNPTEDVIYIDGAETTDIVTITDITGKPIKTETLRQGSLDFKELPSGVYIIKIQHRNFKVLRP